MKRQSLILATLIVPLLYSCSNPNQQKSTLENQEYYGNVPNEFGLIALQGDFYDDLESILLHCGRAVDTSTIQISTWLEAEKEIKQYYLGNGIEVRVCWRQNGWTIIEDKFGLLAQDSKIVKALSEVFNCRVLSFYTQKITGTFSFYHFSKGAQREIVSSEGEIIYTTGISLAEEKNISLEEGLDYEQLYSLLKAIGYDWFETKNVKEFKIIETKTSG